MEVVQENCGMLSNAEVLALLRENKTKGKQKQRHQNTHSATILYSTLKYLEQTPCKDQLDDCAEKVSKFMSALEPYNLTKAERLQLLNLRPQTAVEIQLLIEESEERLTEEQIDSLLATIAEHLGTEEVAVEEDA